MTKPPGPFATMPQEHWYPGKGATLDHVIQLNCQKVVTQASGYPSKWLPKQVVKQPEHGTTSTTKEQKWFSFQMNYD